MANISLTKQQEKFIRDQVKSGRYISASEVVRESLRKLEMEEAVRREELKALRAAIAEGDAAIRRGDTVPGDVVSRQVRALIATNRKRRVGA